MKVSFRDEYWEELYQGTPAGKPKFQPTVIKQYRKTIRLLATAASTEELRQFRGLNFEALSGKWEGYHSVRVNQKYRLILTVLAGEVQLNQIIEEEIVVEEMNHHYR